MKFKDDERIFTLDRVCGIYPTIMEQGTVLAYSREKGKYLVEFDHNVGGHIINYKDKVTKISRGLWLREYEMTKMDRWKDFAKDDTENTSDEAIV